MFVQLQTGEEKGSKSEDEENLQKIRQVLSEEDLSLHVSIPGEVLKARVMKDVISDLPEIIEKAKQEAEEESRVRTNITHNGEDEASQAAVAIAPHHSGRRSFRCVTRSQTCSPQIPEAIPRHNAKIL